MKTSPAPQTYVVRVYRRGAGLEPALAGTVETVSDGERQAFDSLECLCTILAQPGRRGSKKAPPEAQE